MPVPPEPAASALESRQLPPGIVAVIGEQFPGAAIEIENRLEQLTSAGVLVLRSAGSSLVGSPDPSEEAIAMGHDAIHGRDIGILGRDEEILGQ